MTEIKKTSFLDKLKTMSKKKLTIVILSLLIFIGLGVFVIISNDQNILGTKKSTQSEPVIELPADYFEPTVKPYNGYDEVIPYVAGNKFDIKDYIEVKVYGDEYRVYFETTEKNATPTSYQNVGMHPITIHVIDKYKHEALCKTNLLTEKQEVINTLCANDYKPKVSDYENLAKKLQEEANANELNEKAKQEKKVKEITNAGYDPNSRAVQIAQNICDTVNGGNCEQVADEFTFRYFGYSSLSDTGYYEVSEADAIPGDRIIYQSGKAHTAIYLGGGMALHGGIGGNQVRIMGVNALTNVHEPKYYRYDPDNPNGYPNPYDDSDGSNAKTADGAKEAEPSSNMSYDEWVDTLPEDVTALRDACIANYETMDREAAKASPECTAYRDAAHPF